MQCGEDGRLQQRGVNVVDRGGDVMIPPLRISVLRGEVEVTGGVPVSPPGWVSEL